MIPRPAVVVALTAGHGNPQPVDTAAPQLPGPAGSAEFSGRDLAVPNTGRGTSDAVNVRYPALYETGAEIATLEFEIPNDGDDQPTWRLYRVLSVPAAGQGRSVSSRSSSGQRSKSGGSATSRIVAA